MWNNQGWRELKDGKERWYVSINEEECYWHVLEWVGDRHIQMMMDDADWK